MVGFVVLLKTLNKLYCLLSSLALPPVLCLPLFLSHSVFPSLPLINHCLVPTVPTYFQDVVLPGIEKDSLIDVNLVDAKLPELHGNSWIHLKVCIFSFKFYINFLNIPKPKFCFVLFLILST